MLMLDGVDESTLVSTTMFFGVCNSLISIQTSRKPVARNIACLIGCPKFNSLGTPKRLATVMCSKEMRGLR